MNKRPHSVTVISAIFLLTGVVGVAYHLTDVKGPGPFQHALVWVFLVRLLAIVCAVFTFRGNNWARWLLVIWMAYHVVLSAFHSLSQVIVHSLLFAVIAYFLFRPSASVYFHGPRTKSVEMDPIQE